MAKSVKVEWCHLKNPPAKHNTNKFSISDETYTKIGNYINKHSRFKGNSWKQRANTYFLRHRVCFQMQFRTVLINYFRWTYSRGSFTVLLFQQGCPTCGIVARSCDRRVKTCDKRFSIMTPFSDSLKRKTEVSQNFRYLKTKTILSSPNGPPIKTPFYAFGAITRR